MVPDAFFPGSWRRRDSTREEGLGRGPTATHPVLGLTRFHGL